MLSVSPDCVWMAAPPRLTKTRCQMGRSEETAGRGFRNGKVGAYLKRPATTVDSYRSHRPQGFALDLSKLLSRERSSRGRPAILNGVVE